MYSPIYHSYVLYEVGCIECKILAYFSLFPVLLIAHLLFSFYTLRDISILLVLIGHVLNELVNSIFKLLLKMPRPLHPGYDEQFNSGYGMPSAHAGFMAFYTIVWGGRKSIPLSFMVMYSRYHLLYHHVDQLVVGCCLGTIMGLLWTRVMNKVYTMPFKLPMVFSKHQIFHIREFWAIQHKQMK